MDPELLYQKAIKTWGEQAQTQMLFEEIAELQLAICHARRNRLQNAAQVIASEIADVQIMLDQIRIMYGISQQVLEKAKLEKIARLQLRLENYLSVPEHK